MDIFENYYLLNTINDYKSRRALTLSFNDGQAGVIYAEMLVYLTIEYLGQLKNNSKKLEANDGYMVKTPRDVEIELGLSQDKVRLVYKGLEAAKIISIKKKGQDNRTCLKVNLDAVNERLNEFIPKFEAMKNEYVEQQEKSRLEKKERLIKNAQSKIDFDSVNATVETNNPSEIGKITQDFDTCSLIYVVNHYYKKYTGKNYFWNAVKFNTLMTTWRNRANRKGSEYGMSAAIYRELNFKGFGSQRPFELRVRETFSPDFTINYYNKDEYEGVLFDNILKANL